VVYISSSFWLLIVGSHDLSQAEKEVIYSALQAVFLSQLEINHMIQQPKAREHVDHLETVKESQKNLNFHLDLQLHPTVPNGTYLYCQRIGFIPIRAQNL
jgi:hypothetical protein